MTFPRGLFGCALAFLACLRVDATNLRLETSAMWTENIARSSAPSDWRDAVHYEARVAASQLREWRAGLTTTSEVGLSFEHVPKFTKVDAFSAEVGTQVRQKFGFGAFAPALSLDLGLSRRAARLDGDDGWTATSGLRLGKRVTESWRMAMNADWQRHYGRSSIFDTRHHRVFGTLTWDVTDYLQLSHGNGRLWGDFTANASPAIWSRALSGDLGSNISAYYNTISWGVTDAYGPAWVTYRVTGRVNFWWLELSPAIGRDTSLPIRYESLFSVNKVGVKYRQDVWTVQLLHRF